MKKQDAGFCQNCCFVGPCRCLIGVKNKVAARRSQRAELMATPRAGGVATNLEGEISEGSYMSAHISYET